MAFQLLNTKIEGINILEEYFRKINPNELGYYIEKSPKIAIQEFLNSNVYISEDIELINLFLNHLKIVIKKIFNSKTELNYIRGLIKISFISNSIHWNNLFVIGNNIFVKYKYLIKIFEYIEYKKYITVNDIYIENGEIFDMSLLKNISCSIYSILQNLNPDAWNDYILDKYNCIMVETKDIKFSSNYKIIQDPNVNISQGKIPVYWLDSDNIYACFNSICSNDVSFSPYWNQQIIKLEYIDGVYIEIKHIDIKEYEYKNKNKNMMSINKMFPTPFENISIQLTNTIIHN